MSVDDKKISLTDSFSQSAWDGQGTNVVAELENQPAVNTTAPNNINLAKVDVVSYAVSTAQMTAANNGSVTGLNGSVTELFGSTINLVQEGLEEAGLTNQGGKLAVAANQPDLTPNPQLDYQLNNPAPSMTA